MRTKIGSRAGRFKGEVLEVLEGPVFSPEHLEHIHSLEHLPLQIPAITRVPTRNSGFPGSLWYAQSKIM